MIWKVHFLDETGSTNDDAASGGAWEAWTARSQRAGRGRIGHEWHSAPGENLILSAVLPLPADAAHAATLPLAVGLAVARAAQTFLDTWSAGDAAPRPATQPPNLPTTQPPNHPTIKWPNDILAGGRKLAGILCERHGDTAVAGIGLNVRQTQFPPELASRAVSLALCGSSASVDDVRNAVLDNLSDVVETWLRGGFQAIWPQIAQIDALKGRYVAVSRTDGDPSPARGVCGGIAPDGSLIVAGERVWAGESHILAAGEAGAAGRA